MKTAKIEIFKPGVYGESKSRIWSNSEVLELVDNYDPNYRRAPVILGHNDYNGEKPAYGWVKSLEINDNAIVEAVIEFEDELEELIKKGRYKNVSIEVVKNIQDFDYNSEVEGPYLLAVALLGGSQPAVSGLKPVEFEIKELRKKDGIESISFSQDFISNLNDRNTNKKQAKKDDTINKKYKEQFMELEKLKEELEKERQKFKLEKEEFSKKVKEFEAKVAKYERDREIAEFIAENRDKITPALEEQFKKFATDLNKEQFEAYKEQFKQLIEQYDLSVLRKEVTGGENKKPEQEDFSTEALKDLEKLK